MSLIQFSLSTTTVGAANAQVIPTANIVYAIAAAVLLVAAAIVGFIILKRHASNWGNSLIYGLLAGVAFIALLPMLLSAVISIIPAWAEFLTTNKTGNQIVSIILQFVVNCAAFIVGMILLKKSSEKTHQPFDVGSGIMFGFGVFMVELFIGQQLSFYVQYIPACLSINQMGYDEAVKSVVESGLTEEQAQEYLKNLAEFGGAELLYNAVTFLLKGVLEVFAGAVAYGLISGKFPKSCYGLLVGGFAVFYGFNLAFYLMSANSILYIAAVAVLAAVYGFITIRLVKRYVPDEWERFKEKKTGRTSGFPTREKTQQKMPKINMPKE
ncbi:MAG: hypothetical protein IJL43_01950 [Lachnospiraceae bacterium]|nr:hypothetical protein [Lachnospiraceae bacterium]